MFNKIIVAVDGSKESDKALQTAASISKAYGSEIHIAFALHYEYYSMGLGNTAIYTPPHEKLQADGENLLKLSSAKLAALYSEPLETHLLEGEAGKAVTDLAKSIGADLIICGSKGHSDIAGILVGSVSHRICHLAHCTCIVTR